MNAGPLYWQMSVEDYLKLDEESEERYEYIDGYAYMLAGGSPNHAAISANLIGALWSSLHGSSCRVHTSDGKVRLSDRRFVYPDITVSCDQRDRYKKKGQIEYPILVIEVLAGSTTGYDRGMKGNYYRACPTLQEYLLVNAEEQDVQVYRRGHNMWILQIYEPNEQVELSSIGVTLSMADIYKNVYFPEDEEEENK